MSAVHKFWFSEIKEVQKPSKMFWHWSDLICELNGLFVTMVRVQVFKCYSACFNQISPMSF